MVLMELHYEDCRLSLPFENPQFLPMAFQRHTTASTTRHTHHQHRQPPTQRSIQQDEEDVAGTPHHHRSGRLGVGKEARTNLVVAADGRWH